ncbi:SHUGOSHIN 2-like [Bidens hawaiensis]|uniref:SHUGOSHIN 2-like n=1 Tax=Bidens hawaiensis TaxID=980011 RepID=UPI00404A1787
MEEGDDTYEGVVMYHGIIPERRRSSKVIELSGYEMLKLRITLQKMKEQNLQLAQSNSQMQTVLRVIKEKQKVLNHELACKNGVVIAKNLELEVS